MTVRQLLVAQGVHFDAAPVIIDGGSYLRYDVWSPQSVIEYGKVVSCGKRYHDTYTLALIDDSDVVDVLDKPEAQDDDYDPYVEDAKAWVEAIGIPDIDVREFYGMDYMMFNKLIDEIWEDKHHD